MPFAQLGVVALLMGVAAVLARILVRRARLHSGVALVEPRYRMESRYGEVQGEIAIAMALFLLFGINQVAWRSIAGLGMLETVAAICIVAGMVLGVTLICFRGADATSRVEATLELPEAGDAGGALRKAAGLAKAKYKVTLGGAAGAYVFVFGVLSTVSLVLTALRPDETSFFVGGQWETKVFRDGDDGEAWRGSCEIHQVRGRQDLRFLGDVDSALAGEPGEPTVLSWISTDAHLDSEGHIRFRYVNANDEVGGGKALLGAQFPTSFVLHYADDHGPGPDGSAAGYIEFALTERVLARTPEDRMRIQSGVEKRYGVTIPADEFQYEAP